MKIAVNVKAVTTARVETLGSAAPMRSALQGPSARDASVSSLMLNVVKTKTVQSLPMATCDVKTTNAFTANASWTTTVEAAEAATMVCVVTRVSADVTQNVGQALCATTHVRANLCLNV